MHDGAYLKKLNTCIRTGSKLDSFELEEIGGMGITIDLDELVVRHIGHCGSETSGRRPEAGSRITEVMQSKVR
jgi:hypothetical protein